MNHNKRIIITQHKIGGLVQKHVSNGVTPPFAPNHRNDADKQQQAKMQAH